MFGFAKNNDFAEKKRIMEEKNAQWMKVERIEDMPCGDELLKYGTLTTFSYLMIKLYELIRVANLPKT